MTYTHHDLVGKTVAELREIAKGLDHDAVQGYTQMNKEHIIPAICKALGIDTHEHHHAVGIDKAALKARLRTLKKERDAALASHDGDRLKAVRRHRHRLNRQIRAHMI
jgi:hypothetical protein